MTDVANADLGPDPAKSRRSRTVVELAKNGRYQWRLKAPNGRIVAESLPVHEGPKEAERALAKLHGDRSRIDARISHVKEGAGWVWMIRSDRGQTQARSMRAYERYATCLNAFRRFVAMLDEADVAD